MKHGKVNASDSEFIYWVLPDKPKTAMLFYTNLRGGYQDLDLRALDKRAEQYRNLLGRSCEGKWMETNHRYFFELEKDYEMFLIMCQLSA
jgi:hypothetical protein